MFFQQLWSHFQKEYDWEDIFCKLVISVVNPSMAFSVFYIVCELETLCELQSSFFYILQWKLWQYPGEGLCHLLCFIVQLKRFLYPVIML